jgi:hypothetical protein
MVSLLARFFQSTVRIIKTYTKLNTLSQLHAYIETHVQIIRDDHSDWLCGLGCNGCCQRLAETPLLTAAEWVWLKEGLASLPRE